MEGEGGRSLGMASAVRPACPPAATGALGPSPATDSSPKDAVAAPQVVSAPVAPGPAAARNKGLTLREVNAARIRFVVGRIVSFLKNGSRSDPCILLQPCYTLARGIDFSVTAGEVYTYAHDLPPLIKQVYKLRNEASLQPAIMVLLISVKNACRNGWFQDAERKELLSMANEVSSNFCFGSFTSERSKTLSVISLLMPRFYPRMKLGSLFVSFEAKPGYDILVADFNIPRNIPLQEKIRLFVAQTDNMATSSCLISPPHVNFLVNGRGVERRTSGSADVGPQFPTDITKMLKYGTNLIQAIGFFGGNYVIAVALTSTISSSGVPILQDYEQPVVTTIAQDAEIIEGPSKISLNCPISFRRIKTPVKGHHCKHHQCFDYENFMAMNSRKPSWRCPHCNQPVSCVDIRMDQNMVKILAETREDVAHVVISADGSWKVVEHHDTGDKLQSGMLTGGTDDSIRYEANTPSHSVSDVVDLTMEEYAQADEAASPRQMELWNNLLNQSGNSNMCDTEERKPFQDTVHAFSQSESISAAQPVNFTSETIQGTHNQVWDDIWSSISMATPTSVATGHVSRPFIQTVGTGLPASLDPVITDAVSPALYREDAETLLPSTSSIQSSAQVQQFMDNLQLQQTYLGIANETERQPIPRHVTRTPIAIQALPAQTPIPSYHQRPWRNAPNLSSVPSSISVQSPSMLVNPDEICAANTGTGRGHVSERRQVSRVPSIVLSSAQIPSVIQVMGLPAQNSVSTRPLPNQQRGVGSFSMQPHTGGPSSQQQYHNLRPQQTSQAANVMHQPSRFFSVPIQHATQGAVNMVAGSYVNQNPVVNTQQSAQSASARNQVTLVSRMPMSFPTTGESFRLPGGDQVLNVGEGTPEALRSNGVSAVPAEQNWRPTGRMRGSLSGSAYSAALSHYMLQPRPVASSTLGSAAQTRAVSSEYFPLPIVNNVSAGESLNEQPSVRNEDSGGPLQV